MVPMKLYIPIYIPGKILMYSQGYESPSRKTADLDDNLLQG